MMDLIKNIAPVLVPLLGLLAAMFGLSTAVYGYLKAKSEFTGRTADPSTTSLKLVKLAAQAGTTKRSSPKKSVRNLFLTWLASMLLSFFASFTFFYDLSSSDSVDYLSIVFAYGFFLEALFSLCMLCPTWRSYRTLRKARAQEDSEVRRKAEIVVSGKDSESVQARCITALRAVGADIFDLSSETGTIKARKGSYWWSGGNPALVDELTVSIQQVKDNVAINVKSDGVIPTFTPDAERHASNVRLFIDHLIN